MAGNQNRQYSGTTVIKHSNMWPPDLHEASQLTMVNKLIIITIEIFTSIVYFWYVNQNIHVCIAAVLTIKLLP